MKYDSGTPRALLTREGIAFPQGLKGNRVATIMENSTYIGLSRQIALQEQMDMVANNIANLNTPGYREHNVVFLEYLSRQRNAEKAGNDSISMVHDYGQFMNTENGPLRRTENPLDVALEGPGFFGIQTPDGVQYSRAGNFQLNGNRELVTGSGMLVADAAGGTIAIPEDATEIIIARDGTVSTNAGELAQLMVVEFENPQVLVPQGNGLYKTETPGTPSENTRVLQGMVEGSNVNAVLEMTRMIDVSRAYQSTQRMMQSEHDRQRSMIQTLSRTN